MDGVSSLFPHNRIRSPQKTGDREDDRADSAFQFPDVVKRSVASWIIEDIRIELAFFDIRIDSDQTDRMSPSGEVVLDGKASSGQHAGGIEDRQRQDVLSGFQRLWESKGIFGSVDSRGNFVDLFL